MTSQPAALAEPPHHPALVANHLLCALLLVQHCAGVNALALSADERQLWTGSRDSVISW